MKIVTFYFKTIKEFIEKNNSLDYILFVASKTKIETQYLSLLSPNSFGAIFPEIIFKNSVYDEGVIAIQINQNMKSYLIKDINNFTLSKEKFKNVKSIITIVEGFSSNNEHFLLKLFESVDIHTNIIGGGAGLVEDKKRAVIFDKNGFYNNSAILTTLKNDIKIGVRHGWKFLEGPFIVTSCEGNILKKIDYRNAFEVYKEIIEADSKVKVNKNNFSEISKNYPFGIVKYQGEQIVRDPISLEDNNLVLVGKISNNSVINILKGKKETLLSASQEAVNVLLKEESDFVIMFDCITRKNFLKKNFQTELDTIFKQTNPSTLIGAITLGEIANEGNRYINFLNKTCVIGGICF